MIATQTAPSRRVGSTGQTDAARAGTAVRRRLKAIFLGVENARLVMTTVKINGESRARLHRLRNGPRGHNHPVQSTEDSITAYTRHSDSERKRCRHLAYGGAPAGGLIVRAHRHDR
ncbi:hypothetical protein GCM10017687_49930 [Streptomyces echinatus]